MGTFRVDRKLVGHVDDMAYHQRMTLIEKKVGAWVDWKRTRGWFLNSKPKVTGPYDIPSGHGEEADPDYVEYKVLARFKRETPIYMPFEDFLAVNEMAEYHGVDINQEKLPWNSLPKPKEELEVVIGEEDAKARAEG